jgi:hypothetical protein
MPPKVIIIRHAEKPNDENGPPFGVDQDGARDKHSLIVHGWERAGALVGFFAPSDGLPGAALIKPATIYASNPEDDLASKSKRPLQTIAPLAARLGIEPRVNFGKGDEVKLVDDVLQQNGVVLICWQHEKIIAIAQRLVGRQASDTAIPQKWPEDRFDAAWMFDPPAANSAAWRFRQIPQQLLAGDSNAAIT